MDLNVGEVQAVYFENFSVCEPYCFGWFINSLALLFGIFIQHKALQASILARRVTSNAYCDQLNDLWPLRIEEIRTRWKVEKSRKNK